MDSVFAEPTIDVIACRACLSQFPKILTDEILPACPRHGSCPAAKEYWSKQPRGEAEAHEAARMYIHDGKLRGDAAPKEIFVWLAKKYISARGDLIEVKEPDTSIRQTGLTPVVIWDGFADRPDAAGRMERATAALASGRISSTKILDTHLPSEIPVVSPSSQVTLPSVD